MNAMYQAPDLSPNPAIASIILDEPFGSAYGGQPWNYLEHPDRFSGGVYAKETWMKWKA